MKFFKDLKILIVAPAYAVSSNRRWIKEIVRHYGVKIKLLTVRSFEEGGVRSYFKRDNGETYEIVVGRAAFCGRYTLTFFYTKIYGLIKNWKPDIIEIHAEPRSFLTLETVLLRNVFSRESRISFFSAENILHNTYLPFRMVKRIIFKYAQGANVCASETEEVLRKEGFKNAIEIIPLAVDVERFHHKDAFFLRRRLGLEGITIGYIGRITKDKGIITLLNAFKNISLPAINLLIVGDGPDRYIVDKYRNSERLVFIRGVNPEVVVDYLNCMDILVCPSQTIRRWKEQFGRAIVEAMACEVAVIGSDSGAIPEVVGDAGLIFKEGDATDLTSKLMTLIKNGTLRQGLGKKGRARVIACYTPIKISEKYASLYQNLKKF